MDLAAKIKALLDAIGADDAEAIKAAAMDLLASLAGGESPPAPTADDPLAQMADPPKPEEAVAALSAIRKLSGHVNLGEAVAAITKLKADADATLAQAKVLEESSRVVLIGELVKLGAETPATAWADAEKKTPAAHLLAESVASIRTRVTALRAAKGTSGSEGVQPPAGAPREDGAPAGVKVVTLSDGRKVNISAAEMLACSKQKISHEDFAARKANAVKRV